MSGVKLPRFLILSLLSVYSGSCRMGTKNPLKISRKETLHNINFDHRESIENYYSLKCVLFLKSA
jgi:hypothetical protein